MFLLILTTVDYLQGYGTNQDCNFNYIGCIFVLLYYDNFYDYIQRIQYRQGKIKSFYSLESYIYNVEINSKM